MADDLDRLLIGNRRAHHLFDVFGVSDLERVHGEGGSEIRGGNQFARASDTESSSPFVDVRHESKHRFAPPRLARSYFDHHRTILARTSLLIEQSSPQRSS